MDEVESFMTERVERASGHSRGACGRAGRAARSCAPGSLGALAAAAHAAGRPARGLAGRLRKASRSSSSSPPSASSPASRCRSRCCRCGSRLPIGKSRASSKSSAGGLDEVLVTAVDKLASRLGAGRRPDRRRCDSRGARRSIRIASSRTTRCRARRDRRARSAALAFAASRSGSSRRRRRARSTSPGRICFPHCYAIDVAPGLDQGARRPAGHRHGAHSRHRRRPRADDHRRPRRRGALGAHDRRREAPDEFTITLNNITVSFPYVGDRGFGAVAGIQGRRDPAGAGVADRSSITTIAPGVGLESHTEEDGGDIYAPAGTKVQLTITTDKPVARGQLTIERRARRSTLNGHNQVLTADLMVVQGRLVSRRAQRRRRLSNDGDTEYFIRMLNDRPPDVRILRPAGDKQVSPLEEVDDRSARRRRLRRAIARAGDQVEHRQGKGDPSIGGDAITRIGRGRPCTRCFSKT